MEKVCFFINKNKLIEITIQPNCCVGTPIISFDIDKKLRRSPAIPATVNFTSLITALPVAKPSLNKSIAFDAVVMFTNASPIVTKAFRSIKI